MGICVYCGQPSGFLRKHHKTCRQTHDAGVNEISQVFVDAVGNSYDAQDFLTHVRTIASEKFINEKELYQAAVSGVRKMINTALSNHVLDDEEEHRICDVWHAFEITADDLGEEYLDLMIKAQILREMDQGRMPEHFPDGDLPVNLEHKETVVWAFRNVDYYTTRSRTQYVGGSQGASIRLMKGVYYRAGSFKGEPIRTEFLSCQVQGGSFIIGSRNVYFWSPAKVLKIPARKIISAQPYSDGIHIIRDAANAKPQIFTLDDPLFACDVISRLNQF